MIDIYTFSKLTIHSNKKKSEYMSRIIILQKVLSLAINIVTYKGAQKMIEKKNKKKNIMTHEVNYYD